MSISDEIAHRCPMVLLVNKPVDFFSKKQDLIEESNAELYEYYDLESPRHIRIFKLHEGENTESLKCEILHVDLDEVRGKFHALSYVWGGPVQEYQMEVLDEGYIPLTANLLDILKYLRHFCKSKGGQNFWVDQICINQADEVEKAKQVSLMGEIFGHATDVTTHIGPEEAGDHDALEVMTQFVSCHGADGSLDSLTTEDIESRLSNLPPGNDAVWDAVCSLLQRPWVMRAWLFQENLVNENTYLHCGSRLIFWASFTRFAYLVLHRPVLPSGPIWSRILRKSKSCLSEGSLLEHVQRLSQFAVARKGMLKTSDCVCLYCLLNCTLTLQATNPKDKIYALLGIAGNRNGLVVIPDYSKTDVDVFTDVAEQIILMKNDLSIFSYVHDSNTHQALWPSWVPMWTSTSTGLGSGMSYYLERAIELHWPLASRSTPAHINISSDGLSIHVKGIIVDVISQTVGTLSPRGHVKGQGEDSTSTSPNMMDGAIQLIATIIQQPKKNDFARIFTALIHGTWKRCIATTTDVWDALEPWLEKYQYLNETGDTDKDTIVLPENVVEKPHINRTSPDPGSRLEFALRESAGHSLSVTKSKRYCVSLSKTQAGDKIAVLFGGMFCYILRLVDNEEKTYRLVSDAYVEGFMAGEALDDDTLKDNVQDLTIV